MALFAVAGLPALAQVRPDAGTLLESPSTTPVLPPQGGPPLTLPAPRRAVPGPAAVRMVPAAFRFTGNTVFSQEELAPLVAGRLGQPTDLAGLTEAANAVSAYYRSRGYLLTEAYLPEQAFSAAGGTVTIAVIEARVGRVTVQREGSGLSDGFAESLVASHLKPGDAVTDYALDKSVLLLRDLAGYDASATVEPGERVGEANILVMVRAKDPQAEGSVSVDNHGARAAGAARASANASLNNLLGRGDVLAVSAQQADQRGSDLYRVGYTVPVGTDGARVGLSVMRLDYALGKQFEVLGATGKADILALTVSRPFVRSRTTNVYGVLTAEQKKLQDQTTNPVLKSEREIVSLRLGVAGNFTDALGAGTALNNYAATATLGKLKLSPADLALDAATPGGLQTAGVFNKINLEYQRAQYLEGASSLHFMAQAQLASKNLSSAEKMALGGPNGVRGYPVGEGIGDAGALMSLEYRYQVPTSVRGAPLSLLAFYDFGQVRFNQNGSSVPGAANSISLGSIGIGATLGQAGRFLLKTYLAWPTTPASPTTGDPERVPRAWLSAQTWF